MMKQPLRFGAALMLCLGLLAACSKDDDSPSTRTPNEMKLEAHAWYMDAASQTDTAVTDSSILSSCMQDDSLLFGSDRHYLYSDGSTVCDSTMLPYGEGSWAFTAAEDTLSLKTTSVTWRFKVDLLTDSTLGLILTDSVNGKAIVRDFHFVSK